MSQSAEVRPLIDKRELRNVLGTFVTGVTVVTTIDKRGRILGCTANSFTAVSLDPPLVLWNQSLTARSHSSFRDADRFTVNILADDQRDISVRFGNDKAEDKFLGIKWEPGIGGVPKLEGCTAYLECRKVTAYPGGDHAVFIGEVENLQRVDRHPLVFGRGRYLVAYEQELGAASLEIGEATLNHLAAVRTVRSALPEICRNTGVSISLTVWGNHGPTSIAYELVPGPITENLRVGFVSSVLNTAGGRLLAAYLPSEVTASLIDSEVAAAQAVGLATPTDIEWQATLDEIRTHGLARKTGRSIRPELGAVDIVSFAAPVFNNVGEIACAISATGRSPLLSPDWSGHVPATLKEMALALSSRLGYRAR